MSQQYYCECENTKRRRRCQYSVDFFARVGLAESSYTLSLYGAYKTCSLVE